MNPKPLRQAPGGKARREWNFETEIPFPRITLPGSLRCLPLVLLCACGLALTACGPAEPVRLGFLGGLSGRVADLGIDGRNGALLAVELRNAAGGIKSRRVELVSEDDEQDPAVARRAFQSLAGRKVAAIIGPMTSAIAVAVAPLADEAQLVLMSPTVTTNELSGKDDYFLRVISPTREFAKKSAEFHFRNRGLKHVAVAYDLRNKAYSESWLKDYQEAFVAAGGKLVSATGFESGENFRFVDLARRLLAGKPDGILMISNSVDAAMLCQQVRKLNSKVQLATSEWAATERLIEMGGQAVDGIAISQFFDRQSTQPAYVDFRRRYLDRFGKEPGFASLTAFDATNVVMEGLAQQADGSSLKQVLLKQRNFAGAQSALSIDAFGDASRETFMTTIKDGAFVVLR